MVMWWFREENFIDWGCWGYTDVEGFTRKEIKELQGKEIALKKAAAKGSKAEQKAKKKSAEDEVRCCGMRIWCCMQVLLRSMHASFDFKLLTLRSTT
jgi:hypothetical protein